MSGDLDIEAVLAQLHKGSTQEATSMLKATLCKVVSSKCADVKSITSTPARQYDYEGVLDFLKHMIVNLSHVFVIVPVTTAGSDGTLGRLSSKEECPKEKQCYDLTCWILGHLLNVLGAEECASVHSKTFEVIPTLLQMIKVKDVYVFSKLIQEYAYALADLTQIHDQFYKEGTTMDFVAALNRFAIDQKAYEDLNLAPCHIQITSPYHCERLQCAISQVLGHLALDVCQFAQPCIRHIDSKGPSLVWASIGFQLEFGEVELKKVTLELANKLLKFSGLPSVQVLDYVMNCTVALLSLLCSGFNEVEGDYIGLETSLAECFSLLLECTQGHTTSDLQCNVVIDQLLQGVQEAYFLHGFHQLRTQNLKDVMSSILADIYKSHPQKIHDNSVLRERKKTLDRIIIGAIGTYSGVQCLVQYLYYSISLDLEENNASICDQNEIREEGDASSPEPSGAKKRKIVPYTQSPLFKTQLKPGENVASVMSKMSHTVSLLHERLEQLVTNAEEPTIKESESTLEGIQVIIEALVTCCYGQPRSAAGNSLVGVVPTAQPQKSPGKISRIKLNSGGLNYWLSSDTLLKIVGVWKHYLQSVSKHEAMRGNILQCYLFIVNCIGSLVSIQDDAHFVHDIMQDFVWILTLHWLPNDLSWLDLKPKDSKDVAVIGSHLAELLDVIQLSECLRILSLFPKEIASKWRLHVWKQAMVDSREELRHAAVEACPFILYHSGVNANHLVYDVLHGLIHDKSEDVLKEIGRSVGPLACVVSRKAVLYRHPLSWTCDHIHKLLTIQCSACDKEIEASSKTMDNRPKFVDPSMFDPFLKILESPSKEVKLEMTKSLCRLFGHIAVRPSNSATIKMLNNCLQLVEDKEYDIRIAFCKCIHQFIGNQSDQATQTDEIIVTKLKMAAKTAKENGDPYLMQTVLLTVGEIGKVAEGDLLLVMIVSLVDSLCARSSPLAAATAHSQIKKLAAHKGLSTRRLFLQYGRTICKAIGEHIHEAQKKKSPQEPQEIIQQGSELFEFGDVKAFLRRIEQYILPHLVKKATPAASTLIRFIAKQLGDPNHKGPLARNIGYIFCHLVCCCQTEEMVRAFTFLESESEWDLQKLLRCGQNVDSELLLHLGTHYEQVLQGLKILFARLGTCQGNMEGITDEELANILQPKLLGILVHFDNTLNNSATPLEEKKQAYESVISLIRLMGSKHITSVRVRVMTTLRLGLRFKEKGFPELCCRAWNCFVHSIDISVIGPMLAQILVNLLPLLRILPKQVAEIFQFLVVENRKNLKQHFHELYFVPDIPELADVNTALKKYLETASSVKDLKIQIEQLLKGISHESLDVRQLALSKLKDLLHNNQSALHKLILGSETVDPIVSQMVTTLLTGCRETDRAIRSRYGECLGELGAIDPGRLELLSHKTKKELTKFPSNVLDENFAYELINELTKAFLRAEDRNTQDCVAFAIQELIQIYGITNLEGSQNTGAKLWKRYSEEVREILAPLMQSRYLMTTTYDWSHIVKPIYRSKKGNKFSNWVCTLSGYLGSKVKHEKAKKVFEACRGIVKNESSTALYLLPHAIIHVLLGGDDADQKELLEEIQAVLNHVKDPDTRRGSASDLRHLSAQTIFSVLDHLTKWTRHRVVVLTVIAANSARSGSRSTPVDYGADQGYQYVNGFLEKIPQELLAYASYNCGAYSRALMHLEQFVKQSKENVQEHLDFFQKLYVALDESDGVTGITAIKATPPTLNEQILAYESIGQLSDASVCYDRAIHLDANDLASRQGLLKCRLALGELNSAMDLANGMIAQKSTWGTSLNAFRVEAAWKLGEWDKLQVYLKHEEHSRDWNVGLGKILLAAKYRDEENFRTHVEVVRNDLMGPLSAASMEVGSYHRGYDYICRLHMLNELEQGVQALLDFPKPVTTSSQQSVVRPQLETLMEQWQTRLDFVQASYRTQEPMLNCRRIVLELAKEAGADKSSLHIGKCWLHSARIARESGLIQTAHSSLLSASSFNLPEFDIENAKWLWDRSDYDKAQSVLEKAIEEKYPDRLKLSGNADIMNKTEKDACAKLLLLLGTYSEETASLESNTIMKKYKEVLKVNPNWEEGYFHIAKYYDKIMTQLIESDRPEKRGEFVIQVVLHFGQSLLHGNQFIYQSMPRLLALWLDYGAEVMEQETRRNEVYRQGMRGVLALLNKHMATFAGKLAPYQFLTAFPQLISRICHAHSEVFVQLKEIIAKLMVDFPQQTMWQMMAVSKSSYQIRVKRCQEIYNRAKALNPSLNKFLQDATKLTDRLLELCNKHVEQGTNVLRIAQHFKPLQRLIDDSKFSHILLPLQNLMTVTLPSITEGISGHDPFPGKHVYIKGIEDTVEVLPSLQRPKKVTLKGSDGHLYVMLCKPKDDLRKDARLMEFNAIVNKCLRKDPESRRRDLHIRTYTVTPLNEECGLLEWVSNTHGLRNILMKLYREKGMYTSGTELRSMLLPVNASKQKKLDMYRNRLLPKHPPIFNEWFLKTFPDPTSWFSARLAYCRTAAVMSMVGYILGLGDRHGENILLDSINGDCVHVDFNCLFNKGETFDYPEIVPFRLTHNMVDAMGPMGHEGIFRRACEVTLRVMRDQSDPLMSVLKTFIYDPLVEWSKPSKGRSNPTESGEIKNDKAYTHVSNIESRLKGIIKNKTKPRGLPLSVEGHTNHLIKEAMDEENLCEMYIGWAAYL